MCVHAETCGSQVALEHTGDLYSCDHYVEPGYLLGNIGDRHMLELIASPAQRKYGEPRQHYLCPGYQAFFHHVATPCARCCGPARQPPS